MLSANTVKTRAKHIDLCESINSIFCGCPSICQDRVATLRREDLNESFRRKLKVDEYATAAVFAYCRSTRELVLTNAGHPPALWYHARSGTWDCLKPPTPFARWSEGLPLGLIGGTDYVQVALQLNWNDVLILYTDGVSDVRDAADNELGGDGLMEIARSLPVESPENTAGSLLAAIQQFSGTKPRADD